jgi:DNA invertase Pin-like site-specific DNA recombinase
MATYGYFQTETTADGGANGSLAAALAAKALALGEPPTGIYTGEHRAVAQLVAMLGAGDTLVVPGLEHLGESMADLAKNIRALGERGVRVYAANRNGGDLDLPPEAGATLMKVVSLWRKTERAIRSRRSTETARRRKTEGLAVGYPPLGKRVVQRNGQKYLEWDHRQLRHIAEIARRVPLEGVAAVAKDFWRREIKDRRGRPWGKQTPRPFSLNRTPYASFHRAIRAFWRWKWSGELPESYAALAETLAEPNGFGEAPKSKGWTRGGTARRQQERAERKASRRAGGID